MSDGNAGGAGVGHPYSLMLRWTLVVCLFAAIPQAMPGQEALPRELAGTWRITRVLPARPGSACWTEEQAAPLVGSVLTYTPTSLRWRGGVVLLTGVTTRTVSTADLAEEELRGDPALTLADLGFRGLHVREVNLQHEDADVTGATTEVPGDSVLLSGPGRLVLSACGVYLEARRAVTHSVEPAQAAAAPGGASHSGS